MIEAAPELQNPKQANCRRRRYQRERTKVLEREARGKEAVRRNEPTQLLCCETDKVKGGGL